MSEQEVKFEFNPNEYPTMARYHKSDAYIDLLRGPAGTGKTYNAFMKFLRRALEQKASPDGVRRSRLLVARNTYNMLKSSTMKTCKEAYGPLLEKPLGKLVEHPYPEAEMKFDLEDGTKLHFEIFFRAFDSEESARNALGLEPTFVLIDEVSEFSQELVLKMIMRAGRYPTEKDGGPTWWGATFAMNGPMITHFLHDWEKGSIKDLLDAIAEHIPHEKMFEAFVQPPGLIPPEGWESLPVQDARAWQPNPKAENIKNLPGGYGYYYLMLTNKVQNIRAYVCGQYSPLTIGKRVFPTFSRERHVIESLDIPRGTPLKMSFDFGRTPVCVLAVATAGGRLIIVDELMIEDAAVDTLLQDVVEPRIREFYMGSLTDLTTGDPSGMVGGQNVELSPYDVIESYGYEIEEPPCGNDMGARLEGVHIALARLDREGRPMLQVHSRCVNVIEAFETTYIYEKRGAGDRATVQDKPTKSHVNWCSDLMDAVQYLVSAYFSQAKRKPKKALSKRTTRYL